MEDGRLKVWEEALERVEMKVSHRIQFSVSGREHLGWSASKIEQARKRYKIPEDADLIVTGHRVVFTWSTPLIEPKGE